MNYYQELKFQKIIFGEVLANLSMSWQKKNRELIEIREKIQKSIDTYHLERKGKKINLNDYKNSKIIAFAGIGNPKNFFIHLRDNNLNVIEEKAFPDHYKFTKKELQDLFDMAKRNNAILACMHEADAYRIIWILGCLATVFAYSVLFLSFLSGI